MAILQRAEKFETPMFESTEQVGFGFSRRARFIGAFAAAFSSDEESSLVSFICCRGRVLLWIRTLRPDSIRADPSSESQTRARNPGTNTGSCTATEQRKLGGRRSERIISESLEAGPKPVSGKAVKPGGIPGLT